MAAFPQDRNKAFPGRGATVSFFRNLFGQQKTSRKPAAKTRSVRLSVEGLEARDTPSHGFGLGAVRPDFGVFFGPARFGPAFTDWGGTSSTSTLTAALTGASGTSGSVTFTTNTAAGTNSLRVRVTGLAANTTYTVLSGTTSLGTITTDANGAGSLSATNISATLTSGAAITVADPSNATVLSGALSSSTAGVRFGCGGGGEASGSALTATLTGATGTSGTVTFGVNPNTGTNRLTVHVAGLTASTTYTVTSGTATLGTITTNANGSGTLSVNDTTASLATASTLTVTDPTSQTVLSGTLAAPVNPITHLAATLSGATGTSGKVSYAADSNTGTNSLLVRVSGLTANATYTVLSGTNSLGTITTNANGTGTLVASNVSPALASGGTITVADSAGTTVLSGTLATAPSTGHGHHHRFRR
jgi:hypothetical protein